MAIVVGIASGIFSFVLYNLLNRGVADYLASHGIVDFYLQSTIVLGITGLILILGGASVWKLLARGR